MEKSARKYKVKFTVEETEDRRLNVKMNASPFLRTEHIMSIAGSIMDNIAKSNNVPIETVLADFCKGTLAMHENVRLVEQRNILLGAYILATPAPEKEMVTYEVEVESGDTVYDIVSRIATADDDVNELAWQVLQDNHIEDCANLRPGTVLTITVPRIISDK